MYNIVEKKIENQEIPTDRDDYQQYFRRWAKQFVLPLKPAVSPDGSPSIDTFLIPQSKAHRRKHALE